MKTEQSIEDSVDIDKIESYSIDEYGNSTQ